MHGLPGDTYLDFLLGRKLVQVVASEFQTTLYFEGDISVSIEGECVFDGIPRGAGVATARDFLPLIGKVVSGATAVEERHLQITFEEGPDVTVLESDEPFESYTIAGPDGTIVV